MTMWEFHVCMDGWRKAHETEPPTPEMSADQLAELGIEGFV